MRAWPGAYYFLEIACAAVALSHGRVAFPEHCSDGAADNVTADLPSEDCEVPGSSKSGTDYNEIMAYDAW